MKTKFTKCLVLTFATMLICTTFAAADTLNFYGSQYAFTGDPLYYHGYVNGDAEILYSYWSCSGFSQTGGQFTPDLYGSYPQPGIYSMKYMAYTTEGNMESPTKYIYIVSR